MLQVMIINVWKLHNQPIYHSLESLFMISNQRFQILQKERILTIIKNDKGVMRINYLKILN